MRKSLFIITSSLLLLTSQLLASDYIVKINENFNRQNHRENFSELRPDLILVKKEMIENFRNLSGVIRIEPNHKLKLYSQPNDLARQQWWLNNKDGHDLDIQNAWNKSTGSNEIVVATIDSGIDLKHPDLQENLWKNQMEIAGEKGVDDDGNGFVDDFYGWSFYPNSNDNQDYRGHGTHVAGIIGARTNNGIGVAAVNWNVKLMGLNVFPRYIEGQVSDAIRGIDYALDNGADIINASIGASVDDITKDEFESFKEAIRRARDKDILFVAAAGNNTKNNDINGDIPASFEIDNIVSVGSMNRYSEPSGFSNYGKKSVDVFAPGEEIYSTLTRKKYGYKSGTSMSAPVVTGVAALMLSMNPNLTYQQIKQKLINSCITLPSLKELNKCGGTLSATQALEKL